MSYSTSGECVSVFWLLCCFVNALTTSENPRSIFSYRINSEALGGVCWLIDWYAIVCLCAPHTCENPRSIFSYRINSTTRNTNWDFFYTRKLMLISPLSLSAYRQRIASQSNNQINYSCATEPHWIYPIGQNWFGISHLSDSIQTANSKSINQSTKCVSHHAPTIGILITSIWWKWIESFSSKHKTYCSTIQN